MRSKHEAAILLVFCGFPLLWIFLFATYMVRVRLHLGHFPMPMQEDSGLGRDPQESLLMLLMLPLLAAPFVSLPWLLIRRRALTPRLFRIGFAVFLLSVTSLILLVLIDPKGSFSWFLD
jgi:hypothetical protein